MSFGAAIIGLGAATAICIATPISAAFLPGIAGLAGVAAIAIHRNRGISRG